MALGISRGAVVRHLKDEPPEIAKVQTGLSPAPTSRSKCEPFRDVILQMLDNGIDCRSVFQDLQSEHGYAGKYSSVYQFVCSHGKSEPLPFRRLEQEPGYELQVDFGAGRTCQDYTGKIRKTHIFRAELSHSRKGYPEAVTRLTTESFIRCLESAFWRFGSVPKTVVFDNEHARSSKQIGTIPSCIRSSSYSASTTTSPFCPHGLRRLVIKVRWREVLLMHKITL